jgi:hypothetical protein
MLELVERRKHPKLKEVVVEASRALARLDVDRLEELALSCQALNRDLVERDLADKELAEIKPSERTPTQRDRIHMIRHARAALVDQAREATGEMATFARVLEATRSNLHVMNRLRELREGRLEYGVQLQHAPGWSRTESGHGDN